ncbi:MAG: hypothetical protein HC831_24960 [Chloroflexia bacterium]|nr:hypothetical protein [Chloroflexia bacterium]
MDINLRCDESEVIFECSNSYNTNAESTIQKGGVGLENVRRRLELIYPGRHDLIISKENNIFKVALKINYSKS